MRLAHRRRDRAGDAGQPAAARREDLPQHQAGAIGPQHAADHPHHVAGRHHGRKAVRRSGFGTVLAAGQASAGSVRRTTNAAVAVIVLDMIDKPLQAVAKDDIDALISNSRAEDKRIEYKRELPGTSDDEKREFLGDVSAFANTGGGDIVYGVSETAGIPTEALGVAISDFDLERRRLHGILQAGIDPRIPLVEIESVYGFHRGPVVVVRVHPSWIAPHMVTFKNLSRFYVRDAGQRHQMDVQELRSAFVGNAGLAAELRRFRDERLSRVLSDETPVPLWAHAATTIHVLPLNASFASSVLDPAAIGTTWLNLNASKFVYSPADRPNLDGLLIYCAPAVEGESRSHDYIQVFRNGSIEGVTTLLPSQQSNRHFYGDWHEKGIIGFVNAALTFRAAHGLGFPVLVMVSLLRFRGISLFPPARSRPSFTIAPYDRDTMLLPEVVIEAPDDSVSRKLRPLFNVMWQAAGYKGSRSYDTEGEWHPPRE